jgi:CRISPR-associated protein Csx10
MKAITFLIKTKQPILATSFKGDPNSDVSYNYIMGSMIRGVLIGRYIKRNSLENTDILTNETVRRLFFDGTTRYLNAYPATINNKKVKRTLPIPLSWRKDKNSEISEKSDSIEVFDFSIRKLTEELEELESPKSLSESFFIEDGGVVLYKVNRRINIHTSRDRTKGRATKNEGQIFRYDAIDIEQNFQGVILCNDTDENTIRDLLTPSDIWLGGSRSAGYGHVKFSQINSHNSWNEIENPSENRVINRIMKVTLLSDLILRDESGQYTAIPPTNLLSEILGRELDSPKITYMDSVFIGGFNRKWGLPLPQVPAVKAGSVFVYENVQINVDEINKLETEGIGERTVEGFGRVAINWCKKENFSAKHPKTQSSRNKPQFESTDKESESRKLARQIGERILRQRLEKLLLANLECNKLQVNQMTNNQLSRIMIVTRQALDQTSRQPLDNLFSQLTKSSRTKYESAKLQNQPLETTIKQWLDNPKDPTGWMGTDIKDIDIGDEKCSVSDSLAMEYTLRLIMAIVKNATKDKKHE